MINNRAFDARPIYDRELLLYGAKRDAVLELWEVHRYGSDSYGDPDYVSIYGMRPADWYAKGARIMGRTAVECTRDRLGDAIGRDVAAVAGARPPGTPTLVVDPFAGSGNTLYWLLQHLPGARGVGFEQDAGVSRLSQRNLDALELPVEILNSDYLAGLTGVSATPDELVVAFLAPPWGNALDETSGLDLRRTTPPVTEIVDFLETRFGGNRLLCAVQVYELVVPGSQSELESRFDWSILKMYDLNVGGRNHGIVIGTKGWTPSTCA